VDVSFALFAVPPRQNAALGAGDTTPAPKQWLGKYSAPRVFVYLTRGAESGARREGGGGWRGLEGAGFPREHAFVRGVSCEGNVLFSGNNENIDPPRQRRCITPFPRARGSPGYDHRRRRVPRVLRMAERRRGVRAWLLTPRFSDGLLSKQTPGDTEGSSAPFTSAARKHVSPGAYPPPRDRVTTGRGRREARPCRAFSTLAASRQISSALIPCVRKHVARDHSRKRIVVCTGSAKLGEAWKCRAVARRLVRQT